MAEETKVDKEYLEAFNLGYELAKELKLKSPMFENLPSDNIRMNAMQYGMAQFSKEMGLALDNENNIPKNHGRDQGKGLDHSI